MSRFCNGWSSYRNSFLNFKLVHKAGKLDPVIGRDGEIRTVVGILSRGTKKTPVLIGKPSVGKPAAVQGLAQRIVGGDVPRPSLLASAYYLSCFTETSQNMQVEMNISFCLETLIAEVLL
jgi:hypothetical protein